MKLSVKLSVLVAVLLFGIMFTGIFSLYQMSHLNEKLQEITSNWLPATVSIQRVNTLTAEYRIYEVGYVYSEDTDMLKYYDQKMATILSDIDVQLKIYVPTITGPEEQALYDAFDKNWRDYRSLSNTVFDLARQKKTAEAIQLLRGDSRRLFTATSDALLKDVDFNVRNGKAASAVSAELYTQSFWSILILMIVISIIALVLGWYIVRGTMLVLGKDPAELMQLAKRVTNGDYAVIDGVSKESVGVFGEIIAMVKTLRDTISKAQGESERARVESQRAQQAMEQAELSGREAQSKTAAMLRAADRLEEVGDVVSSASEQLATRIAQSERGASDQAGRMSETATAMREMNAAVMDVAKNAGAASDVSVSTRQKAEAGADVVRKAVGSIQQVQRQSARLREDMGRLDDNAKAISQIMSVISDIADQTNLLALNAAIEAARAGDAGRGFAVVADEVRKLAEKTMASTTDVGNAIRSIQESAAQSMAQVDASVSVIEEATEYANQSGAALGEIVKMVDRTADQVRAIAIAAEEQSSSSEEINHSVTEVNEIAGETAEAMQGAAQAVNDLARQAQILASLIDEMKRA